MQPHMPMHDAGTHLAKRERYRRRGATEVVKVVISVSRSLTTAGSMGCTHVRSGCRHRQHKGQG